MLRYRHGTAGVPEPGLRTDTSAATSRVEEQLFPATARRSTGRYGVAGEQRWRLATSAAAAAAAYAHVPSAA